MPLRDHFHPPLDTFASWEEVHGLWPGMIAVHLNSILPPQFRCGVQVHLGTQVELASPRTTPAPSRSKRQATLRCNDPRRPSCSKPTN